LEAEVDPDDLARRFWRMPLELTIHFASTSRTFIDVVTERRPAGLFVPDRCTVEFLAGLAVQADVAEQVAACRLAAQSNGGTATDRRRGLEPNPN
jgi:hypothetical protein